MSMKTLQFKILAIRYQWRDYRRMYQLYHYRMELGRLIKWSAKKRLTGPRKAYDSQFSQCEERYTNAIIKYPCAVWVVPVIYHLIDMFVPRKKLHKGAAARYSRKRKYARRFPNGSLNFTRRHAA